MRHRAFPLAAAVVLGLCGAAQAHAIDPARMSAHVKVLASDDFEGRQPGTRGGEKATAYVINAFKAIGLEPAGPHGGWEQPVFVDFNMMEGPATAAVRIGGRWQALSPRDDIAIQPRLSTSRVELRAAPVVFAGYALGQPGWDDFAGVDVRGKVVLAFFGAPKAGPAPGDVNAFETSEAKRADLARRGAAGVIFLNADGPAGWGEARAVADQPQISLPQSGGPPPAPPLVAILNTAPSERLLATAGLNLTRARKLAETPGFRARVLPGAAVSAAFDVAHRTVQSSNVLGMIRGASRPDETVIYSAHWDHVGRADTPYIDRNPPARAGDDIYNGAIDNAAGVAGLLEVARNLAAGPRPARTVAFIAWTEEETWHLGARRYLAQPVFPLATTAALLNIDVVSMRGPTREVSVQGAGRTTLEDSLARIAARKGLTVDAASSAGGIYRRSDHYQFAKAGVPVLYIHGGSTLLRPQDSTPAKEAFASGYLRTRYHNVTDEWSPDLDFSGAAQHVELLLDVGRELANSNEWPAWRAGVDFDAVRRASDAARAAR